MKRLKIMLKNKIKAQEIHGVGKNICMYGQYTTNTYLCCFVASWLVNISENLQLHHTANSHPS